MIDSISKSLMGNPHESFKYFNQGYINPHRESFIVRSQNVLFGSFLGITSLIGQVAELALRIFQANWNEAGKIAKNLAQTLFIVPAGLYFSVIFGLHFIVIEIPKTAYREFANTELL